MLDVVRAAPLRKIPPGLPACPHALGRSVSTVTRRGCLHTTHHSCGRPTKGTFHGGHEPAWPLQGWEPHQMEGALLCKHRTFEVQPHTPGPD